MIRDPFRSTDEKRVALNTAFAEADYMDYGALESEAPQPKTPLATLAAYLVPMVIPSLSRFVRLTALTGLLLAPSVACAHRLQTESKGHRPMFDAHYFFGKTPALPLGLAIDKDDTEALNKLVTDSSVVNFAGTQGVTPLMFALVQKKLNAVETLLKHGAKPNTRADDGTTAVTLAIRLAPANLQYLKTVLAHGGDPNARESADSDPVLVQAISQDNVEAIKVLAATPGVDLNIKDRTDDPAILVASAIGHWDCVYTLLELGAKWRFQERGFTVADNAHGDRGTAGSVVYEYKLKVIEFLKQHGTPWPPPKVRAVQAMSEADKKRLFPDTK